MRIEDRRRLEAARQVLATFEPENLPTTDEQRELLALWASPHAAPPPRKPRRRRR